MAILSIQTGRIAMESLGIYRGLLQDRVIHKLHVLFEHMAKDPQDIIGILSRYNEFYHTLVEKGKGSSLKDYMIIKILFHDNAFARWVQSGETDNMENPIVQAAVADLDWLYKIASILPEDIEAMATDINLPRLSRWNTKSGVEEQEDFSTIIVEFQNSLNWGACINDLASFHRECGSGLWAKYKGFVWEGEKLQGVVSLDPIRLSQLIGYETERQKVIDNTRAFIDGYPANNMLLYGGRGTGKSSTVKAMLNEYYNEGLRIIEISKKHLGSFPKVIRQIKDDPQKFILFIDDLSFEYSEGAYASLKAVLEGGLETRPKNVVIYATSNRRHLIKEKFSDRAGLMYGSSDDEVRAADTMQEKLSLSDRFGITVTFSSPNQKQYLEIVDGLVKERGIQIDQEKLHKKAIQWEMWYNAKSPRTATQFVDWLEGSVSL